jgi:hypothetical protein
MRKTAAPPCVAAGHDLPILRLLVTRRRTDGADRFVPITDRGLEFASGHQIDPESATALATTLAASLPRLSNQSYTARNFERGGRVVMTARNIGES